MFNTIIIISMYLGSEVFSLGLVTLLKNLSRVWDIVLAKLQLAVVHVGAYLWSNLSSPAHNLLTAHVHVLSNETNTVASSVRLR